MSPETRGGSGLSDRAELETHPGLFNAAHAPGTTFRGKIVGEVRQVHSTCHPDTKGRDGRVVGERKPQYFQYEDPFARRSRAILTLEPFHTEFRGPDGKPVPNKPVMDQVVTIATGVIDSSIEGDDGVRAWFVQGSTVPPQGHKIGDPVASARRALLDAVRESRVIFLGEENEGWGGKNIEVRRVARVDPSKSNSPWLWQCRIWAD